MERADERAKTAKIVREETLRELISQPDSFFIKGVENAIDPPMLRIGIENKRGFWVHIDEANK